MTVSQRPILRLVAGLTLAVAGLAGAMADAHSKPLRQAVEDAIETHPSVKTAEAIQDNARATVKEAVGGWLPSVDFEGATGYQISNNRATRSRSDRGSDGGPDVGDFRHDADIQLSQLLFDGFATSNRIEASELRLAAAGFDIRSAREEIALRVVEAYLDVLRNIQLYSLAESNVRDHVKFLEQTRTRAATGVGPQIDVAQAEARLSLAQSRLLQTRGALRAAAARYVESTGEQPANLQMPVVPVYVVPGNVESGLQLAFSNSPALKSALQTVQAAFKDIETQEGDYWPEVTGELRGNIAQNLNGTEASSKDVQALLNFSYNIFNGFQDEAQIEQAAASAREAASREAAIRRTIEQRVRVGYSALETARDRVPVIESNERSSLRVLDGYRRQFELGKRTLQDLLDAKNELFQVQSNLTNARFAFAFANYQVLNSVGALVDGVRGAVQPVAPIIGRPGVTPGFVAPQYPQPYGQAYQTPPGVVQPGAAPYYGAPQAYQIPGQAVQPQAYNLPGAVNPPQYGVSPLQPPVQGPSFGGPAPSFAPSATITNPLAGSAFQAPPSPAALTPVSAPKPSGGPWSVQIGAYLERENADIVRREVAASGFNPTISSGAKAGRTWNFLRLTGYNSRARAESAASQFRSKTGRDALVVRN